MSNTLNKQILYLNNAIDEIYKIGSLTNDINNNLLTKHFSKAGEIKIPKISTTGLKDYNRDSGYNTGSVTLEWETKKINYERGTKFEIDILDNLETGLDTLALAFGQFIKNEVIPEEDAFTFAKISELGNTYSSEVDFTTGEEVIEALVEASANMSESEVPEMGRILYIRPTLLKIAKNLDLTKNTKIFDSFDKVVEVPKNRFYSKITLKGSGGYEKESSNGKELNFLIVQKNALIKTGVHITNDIIPAKYNNANDKDILKYRRVLYVGAYENKLNGIYVSKKNS